jgi:putative FmdB family regulatory protein
MTREGAMVTYEFTCKKCGKAFEVSCHMEEREAKAACPKCGSRKVRQKLSADFSSPRPAKY